MGTIDLAWEYTTNVCCEIERLTAKEDPDTVWPIPEFIDKMFMVIWTNLNFGPIL